MKMFLLFFLSYTLVFSYDILFSYDKYSFENKELVYKNSYSTKLSELTWKSDNINLLGLSFVYDNYFKYIFTYKKNIKEDKAFLSDFDWLSNNEKWTDYSKHPDTKVVNVEHFDFEIKKEIYQYKNLFFNLSLAYRYEEEKYEAYGGSYIYSSSNGFRDLEGDFSGLVITYKTKAYIPYIKSQVEYKSESFINSLSLSFSNLVYFKEYDTHHLRNTQFNANFYLSKYLAIDLRSEYKFTKSLSFLASYKYSKFYETKGNMQVINLNTSSKSNYSGAAYSKKSDLFSFYIKKTF
ncbi:MAG: omptin family outer membrane protease [Campylobacterales bacterium]|nr:omptin family outer membrane protease [Campylobacterales bacterium]